MTHSQAIAICQAQTFGSLVNAAVRVGDLSEAIERPTVGWWQPVINRPGMILAYIGHLWISLAILGMVYQIIALTTVFRKTLRRMGPNVYGYAYHTQENTQEDVAK